MPTLQKLLKPNSRNLQWFHEDWMTLPPKPNKIIIKSAGQFPSQTSMGEFLEQSGRILILWRFIWGRCLGWWILRVHRIRNPHYLGVIQLSTFLAIICELTLSNVLGARRWGHASVHFGLSSPTINTLSSRPCLPHSSLCHAGLVMICALTPPLVFEGWGTPNHLVLCRMLSMHSDFLSQLLCLELLRDLGTFTVMPAPLPSLVGTSTHL